MTLTDAKNDPAVRTLVQGVCVGTLDMESLLYGVSAMYPDMTLVQFVELYDTLREEYFE